jgi:integrase
MQFAIDIEMRADDPTLRVKGLKIRSPDFLTWSEEHIARYRATHALGTRARLAFELLLCTGQRRSDVVRMGPQHVCDNTLSMRQQKTGTLVQIPVLAELQEALNAMPAGDHLCYLMTEFGKPFTAAGFGNWFREQCNAAGLPPGYSAHGLRKAAATKPPRRSCAPIGS